MSFHGLVAHLLGAEQYSIMWMSHSLFTHSPTEEHPGCLQVLVIIGD